MIRTYTNEKTGENVVVMLLYGLAQLLSSHTPTVCYPAAGFKGVPPSRDVEIPIPESTAKALFREEHFVKYAAGTASTSRSIIRSATPGEWRSDMQSRWKSFRYHPGMFKIQVQRQETADSKANEKIVEEFSGEDRRGDRQASRLPTGEPTGLDAPSFLRDDAPGLSAGLSDPPRSAQATRSPVQASGGVLELVGPRVEEAADETARTRRRRPDDPDDQHDEQRRNEIDCQGDLEQSVSVVRGRGAFCMALLSKNAGLSGPGSRGRVDRWGLDGSSRWVLVPIPAKELSLLAPSTYGTKQEYGDHQILGRDQARGHVTCMGPRPSSSGSKSS